jgi:hypothetical protein
MSKYDSPALVDPTLFWGWVMRILSMFIKTAKGVWVTRLLSEDSAVFDVSLCDPQRRLGSSLKASSHVQNLRQRWTPACAADHRKGVWATLLLFEKSGLFSRDENTPSCSSLVKLTRDH